jgi:hypothetical protein
MSAELIAAPHRRFAAALVHVRGAALSCFAGALLFGCGSTQAAQATTDDPLAGAYVDGPAKPAAPAAHAAVAPGHTRDVSPRELLTIEKLMAAAERVRGLRFDRQVPVLVQDAEAIAAYVDSQIKADELERSRTIYTALGLLAPDLDVRALLLRLMGEQIVGYYDVERGQLIVRDDVMRAFGGKLGSAAVDLAEARVVLVHELVHALQDQHLGLSSNIDAQRDSDADNAFRALIEGDATLAMIAYALERESLPLSELTRNPARVRNLSELVRSSPLAGSELGSAPPIVRVPLLSAYVDGLTFAAYLHGDGGWGRVDRAHADAPQSTEQVLHPERFARHEAPEKPRLPSPRDALGSGYELLHEDTLGELELRVYFGAGAQEAAAQHAAQGWGGDRLYAYRGADQKVAIVWLTTWDDEREAREAEQAAARVAATSAASARAEQLVERAGRAVLVLRQVPGPLQDALRKRFERWAISTGASAAHDELRAAEQPN